ncbi:MAG TPA: ribonuclease J [Stellaceae bacterium]|nr:ribonuclease J [Stellaceae bacterium]
MTAAEDPNRPEELVFLALGGAGEIGMNLNLYGYAGQWLMIDCGISFGDDTTPGIEVIMPDPGFIVERRDRLAGIVLTHAHEDHLGAIQYLWPQLKCTVYATPFTAAVLRAKLEETNLEGEVPIVEVPMSGKFTVGPFELELITLTHSIPEPNAVVVRTPLGVVLHTGDWKLDPDPLVGPTADEAALRSLGDGGVLAMICDSTNALRPGESGSEAKVRESLTALVEQCRHRVAVACFATNVARLTSIASAAAAHGRHTALVGRSLWRIERAARETGYLEDVPAFLTDEEGAYLPREKVVFICTGSQGEPRSALVRIAEGEHPHVVLEEGDAVIFSSRIIPGNERAIGRLHNRLASLGVELLTEEDHFVHVSGHPAQDELLRMYQMVRPKVAIPVHGEARHLRQHLRLAEDCQVPQPILTFNGDMIRLGPLPAAVVGQVATGRLALDGSRLLSIGSESWKTRRRVAFNGVAVATVVLGEAGELLSEPRVSLQGLGEPDAKFLVELGGEVAAAVKRLGPRERSSDAVVSEAARIAVRRAVKAWSAKRPVTEVQVVRIASNGGV